MRIGSHNLKRFNWYAKKESVSLKEKSNSH